MMKPLALKEIVEERKERAIETLSDSYAKDGLPLEEYERLVEYINKIESERELVVVEKIVAEYAAVDTSQKPAKHYDEDDDELDYHHQGNFNLMNNLNVMSSRVFFGPLKSGSQFVSILGSGEIKIRKSDLAKRQTILNAVSILGSNTIFVESGIRVINKVIPVLGSADVNRKVTKQAREGEPELVISGVALLGNISVKLLKDRESELR